MARIVAISGGIGSGKSVVSKVLNKIGYYVYDCDSMAKLIMDNSQYIKDYIKNNISTEAITNNSINRQILSNVVFNNPTLLHKLNSVVHTEVLNNINNWIIKNNNERILFIETAILYQSGIDKIVDEVWEIYAPEELRIERVIRRNNLTRQQVIARINSQKNNHQLHYCIKKIINDNISPILPQMIALL